MGEVGGGVSIGGGDDEPAKIDVRTRRRCGRHRWASPRAPSMSLCRTVEDEEEAGEVDALGVRSAILSISSFSFSPVMVNDRIWSERNRVRERDGGRR